MPLRQRVRAMDVPVIGVVTDKETGLVPAVAHVFPEVPYQYCQTHFLKNCAKPLAADLAALQASVRRRAEAVREIGKLVMSSERAGTPSTAPPTSSTEPAAMLESSPPGTTDDLVREVDLVREICDLVRVNSHVSGRAPFDPAELKRHERFGKLRSVVNDAQKKTTRRAREGTSGPYLIHSPRPSNSPGTKRERLGEGPGGRKAEVGGR